MGWRHWFGPGRLTRTEREQDIEREIRSHLELEAEEAQGAGSTKEAAGYAAQRAFGNRALVSEDIRAVWGTPSLDALLQDVRYAWRTMRRAPGFTAIAVGSSALGIGACSLIFAIVNFAILRPLPVDDPGRLLSLSERDGRSGEAGGSLSYPDVRDLRHARTLEGLAAANSLLPASIGSSGDPQRHFGAIVTANYFAVVKPGFAAGRGFDPGRDDTPGEPPAVVLGHDLWRTRFGGDPGVVGRTVSINKRAATVVGVTVAGFRGTEVGIVSEFWIPFSMIAEMGPRGEAIRENRQRYWLSAVGRLRPGVDADAARAELDVMARTLNSTHARDESRSFHLERAGQINPSLRGTAQTLFSVFLGATLLVLLAACANVANLLLGRASARRQEIAARMALGASRGRLVRQLLTESLVLALLGGAGGWIVAAYGASLAGLVRLPLPLPLDLSFPLDYRVLFFCAGLSLLTGFVFGLVPALRATRPDLVTDLKSDPRVMAGAHRFGFRNGLVVAQVAICTLLLLCTGLFLRSFLTARGIDVGVSHRNLLLLAFDPAMDHRPDPQSRQLLREILDQAQAVPGVESATLTTGVPLTFIIDNSRFRSEESAADPNSPRTGADIYAIGPRFFETLGIRLLAGDVARFDQGGTEGIAIVNDAFAQAVFPGESPLRPDSGQSSGQALGRRFVGDGKRLEVVGVAATAKSRTIGEPPRPVVYLPVLAGYSAEVRRVVTLVVKTRAAAATYAGPIREAVRRADPSLAVFNVRTMESQLSDALVVPRLTGALSVIAASIGIAIATIGVYGVVSFAVARRRRELGIRLAIGARPREILVMIVRQGIVPALIGTAVGVLAALGVTRFAASLLYGVDPIDPITFVVVPPFLIAVALLACLFPARAAARLDPVDVLRSE